VPDPLPVTFEQTSRAALQVKLSDVAKPEARERAKKAAKKMRGK
jgi:hypothetical protein